MSQGVRFASTHFANGNVTLELKATFRLGRQAGDEVVYSAPFELTATASVEAYNKGLVLATQEEYNAPGAPGYSIPNPPLADGFAIASQRGAVDGATQLTAMNHVLLNQGPAHQMTEADLAPLLKEATAFFGFTHGETTHFRASTVDQLFFSPLTGTGAEVGPYVQDNRQQPQKIAWYGGSLFSEDEPGLNVVVMHACSVLANTLLPLSTNTLKNNAPWQEWQNRAIAGYAGTVWSLAWADNFAIDEHAKIVYEELRKGATIEQAVVKANLDAATTSDGSKKLHMVVRGDLNSRLMSVYTGNNAPSSWYLLIPGG